MNQTILFTPVGGTDPISSTNCRDGSMLHICRVYQPDKVIMYMSKEMLEFQEQDDRYRYCLDRLGNLQNRRMQYEIIERKNLVSVHEFDYYYQDFREIIQKICQQMDETDTLLLNVSSGTPAMKSGLLVLLTLGEFPARAIQVATPERKINEHVHKNYDVQLLWDLDEDNEVNFDNRCKEVQCPTLSKIKKEEIIKKHISVYDYAAALEVAKSLPEEDTKAYKDIIYMASRRILLDFTGVDQMIKKTGYQCLPVRSSAERKYFEYALNIGIKLKKEEYADFIRSITPLIVDLLEIVLKKQCKITVDDYCVIRKKKGMEIREWSADKLRGTEIKRILDQRYGERTGGFRCGPVYSDHLKCLLQAKSKDAYLIKLAENLRSVESNIRNLAAHQIVSVTEDVILQRTGYTGKKIMEMIKALFNYTGISMKEEYWESYELMNQEIIKRMSAE